MDSMGRAGLIRTVLAAVLLCATLSCAGLGGKSPAQSEFDTGLSLFNRGRFEEAVPHFERATEHEPEFGDAYFYLARSYINLDRWEEALYPLRAAMRLSPGISQEEITDLMLDVLLRHATELDPDSQEQLREMLKAR
jgi:tetratricopeptide (TPR) repeat protein